MDDTEKTAANNTFILRDLQNQDETCEDNSRRRFLTGTVSASVAIGSGVFASSLPSTSSAAQPPIGPQSQITRQLTAQTVRIDAANRYLTRTLAPQERNDDEVIYSDRRAVYSKALVHNTTFTVTNGSYNSLLTALSTGAQADFDNIIMANNADRKLANPQAAFAFDLTGGDAHESRINPAPALASAEQAAEMAEVYWHAFTRDVPFTNFDTDPTIAEAITDLNGFSQTVGPKDAGLVTPSTIFRGVKNGPYISQFLLKDIPYGPSNIVQRYSVPLANNNFMETSNRFLRIQRGRAPNETMQFDATPRYIYNQRALGEYVHQDVVAQAYLNAALIMLSYGPNALSPTNPYINNPIEGGFITFGVANILDLINRAATVALKTAWYQKWLVHRRLRPEVFAMRVAVQNNGTKDNNIHPELMDSYAVWLAADNNSEGLALLPQAYTEGSPTHPAYPAGHATIAGACSVILKAFFNPDFIIPNPVIANSTGTALTSYTDSDLTLGAEIEKLATNITLGRDAAGVHYRSDGSQGLIAGEQVAARLLQDVSLTYSENFDGFDITRLNGNRFIIKDGEINPAS